jgi:hypothetical protein
MYFTHMGRVWHGLKDGSQIHINNITKFCEFEKRFKQNPHAFLDYTVKDDERAEVLSKRLYGSGRFWWSIYLFNNIYDVDAQWPLNQEQLSAYIRRQYPDNDPIDTLYYTDTQGNVADLDALKALSQVFDTSMVVARYGLSAVSIQEHETRVNDQKRAIRMVDPTQITFVESELARLLNEQR